MSIFINRGFSLLELIAVLTITSVLAITVIPHFYVSNNDLVEARNRVLIALRHSRELALARAQTNTSIRFIASTTTVDVREEGDSVQFPDASYPLSLPPGITVQRGAGILIFDKLGSSTPLVIEITDDSASDTVTVTGGGYAY